MKIWKNKLSTIIICLLLTLSLSAFSNFVAAAATITDVSILQEVGSNSKVIRVEFTGNTKYFLYLQNRTSTSSSWVSLATKTGTVASGDFVIVAPFGTHYFRLKYCDMGSTGGAVNCSYSAQAPTFTLQENSQPSLAPINDITINEDGSAVVQITLNDVDTPIANVNTFISQTGTATLTQPQTRTISGTGSTRTVTITPAANDYGMVPISIIAQDNTGRADSERFIVTVNPVNDRPTISNVGNKTINEDTSTGTISFTVDDVDNDNNSLSVSATSSNTSLIPNGNINVVKTGASTRTVQVTPVANKNGSATITLTVSDGSLTATDTFVVTVNSVNDAPTISDVGNRSINEDTSTGTINFTVSDIDTALTSLVVTRASSNETLVPVGNISLGGSGGSRTVNVTPAANQYGSATITLTVSDGSGGTKSDTFVVTVNPVNDAPTISNVGNQTINEDTSTSVISFTVNDIDNDNNSLSVSGTSSSTSLIPNGNINIVKTGASTRTVQVTPTANQYGNATITLTVSDGSGGAAVDTFVVAVIPDNDAPTISNFSNKTINEDSNTGNIGFTVNDIDTASTLLTVTATSSNAGLIPNGNLQLGGSGSNRTIRATPLANQFGNATITVQVSDGMATPVSKSFVVTVQAVNDPSVISELGDLQMMVNASPIQQSFTISDIDSTITLANISTSSSNTTLIPINNIEVSYANGSGSISVTPAPNRSGNAVLNLIVNDGTSVSRSFNVGVLAPSDIELDTAAINPPDETSEGTADYFGALEGSYSVGNDASFNYSLPIAVTPGVNGMQPNISVSYNSNGKNGLLGYGWFLGGFSKISRCPASMVRDGYISSTRAGDGYKFCLDGERLIRIGASEYRTEKESFRRILKTNDSWQVINRDGSILTYGNNDNSRISDSASTAYSTYTWFLTRRQDVSGNYLEYSYTKTIDQNNFVSHRPSEITYTKNVNDSGLDTEQKVIFEYEDRDDLSIKYVGGIGQKIDQRLSAIEIQTNDIRVRRYGLNYQAYGETYNGSPYNNPAKTSRLYQITLCFEDDTQCAEDVEFAWTESTDDLYPYDVLDAQLVNEKYNMIRNQGGVPAQIFLHLDDDEWIDAYYDENYLNQINTPEGIVGLQVATYEKRDMNGDGFPDIVKINKYFDGINVYLNIPGAVEGTRQISTVAAPEYRLGKTYFLVSGKMTIVSYSGNGHNETGEDITSKVEDREWDYETRLVDINNDGHTDLVRFRPHCSGYRIACGNSLDLSTKMNAMGDLSVLFNTGNGWSKQNGVPLFTHWGHIPHDYTPQFMDVNGDTLPDMLLTEKAFLTTHSSRTEIYLNTGRGIINEGDFEFFGQYNDWGKGSKSWEIGEPAGSPGDYNGDGIRDFARAAKGSTEIRVVMGLGDGTYIPHSIIAYPELPADLDDRCKTGEDDFRVDTYCNYRAVDYNGDGLDDLVLSIGSNRFKPTCRPEKDGCFFTNGDDFEQISDPQSAYLYLSKGSTANGAVEFAAPIPLMDVVPVGSTANTPPGEQFPNYADYNRDGFTEASLRHRHQGKLKHYITGVTQTSGTITPAYHVMSQEVVLTHLGTSGVNAEGELFPRFGVESVLLKTFNSLQASETSFETYTFSDAKAQIGGYGSLGYGRIVKRRRTADQANYWIETDSTYYQSATDQFRLANALKRQTITVEHNGNRQLISDSRFLRKVRVYEDDSDSGNGSPYSPHYFSYIVESSEQTWDLDGTAISKKHSTNFRPDSYNCSEIALSDLSDDLAADLIVDAGSAGDSDYHADGVLLYSATTSCDQEIANDVPTDSSVQIRAFEQLNITSKGSNITGLVQKSKQYAWLGSNASHAAEEDFAERTTGFTYNDLGQLRTQTIEPEVTGLSPLHHTSTYTYNTYGSVASVTETWDNVANDGLPDTGRVTTVNESWDGSERTVVSTSPLMPAETTVYHPVFGTPISHIDVNGLETTSDYDVLGRPVLVTYADGTSTTNIYRKCANCFSSYTSGPNLHWFMQSKSTGEPAVLVGYNIRGEEILNRTRSMSGTHIYKANRYNASGKIYTASNWSFNPAYKNTRYTYDVLGRISKTRYADGSEDNYSYQGLTTQIENSIDQTEIRYYNGAGQVVQSVDNASTPVNFSYWPFGELNTTIVDNDTKTTISIEYDALGRRTGLTDPNTGTSTFTYNGLGLLSSQTDAKSQVTRMQYDVLGRQTVRTDNATGSPALTHTWVFDSKTKGIGKLGSMSGFNTDGTSYNEDYTYTAYGLLKTASRQFGGASYSTIQHYDNYNRLIGTTYPDGFTTKQSYNTWGYATQIKSHLDNKTLWQANTADADGQITQFTLGNGVVTNKTYDANTRAINTITASLAGVGTVQNHDYDFDALGNLIRREDLVNNVTQTFEYEDGMNRLTSVQNEGGVLEAFTYNALGNIQTKAGLSGSYQYGNGNTPAANDAGPHAVTRANGLDYVYDNVGNVISVKNASGSVVRSVQYSSFGKPTQITNEGKSTNIVYDANHNRIKRTDSDGRVTKYGILGMYEQTTYGATQETVHYIGDFAIFVQRQGPGAASYFEYLHRDHIGSVVARTGENLSSISAVDAMSNGVWGERRLIAWDGPEEGTGYVPEGSARGYTGHEHLDGMGLIHMNGRVYDPEIGRFLSADPFIQAPLSTQSYNRYSYVFNNPLSYTDPSGYECRDGITRSEDQFGSSVSHRTVNTSCLTGDAADQYSADYQALELVQQMVQQTRNAGIPPPVLPDDPGKGRDYTAGWFYEGDSYMQVGNPGWSSAGDGVIGRGIVGVASRIIASSGPVAAGMILMAIPGNAWEGGACPPSQSYCAGEAGSLAASGGWDPDDPNNDVTDYSSQLSVSGNVARTRLRSALDTPAGQQAHHNIPWQMRNHPAVVSGARGGFNMNGRMNGTNLGADKHFGSHPTYTRIVTRYLNKHYHSGMSDRQAAQLLIRTSNKARDMILRGSTKLR